VQTSPGVGEEELGYTVQEYELRILGEQDGVPEGVEHRQVLRRLAMLDGLFLRIDSVYLIECEAENRVEGQHEDREDYDPAALRAFLFFVKESDREHRQRHQNHIVKTYDRKVELSRPLPFYCAKGHEDGLDLEEHEERAQQCHHLLGRSSLLLILVSNELFVDEENAQSREHAKVDEG